MKSRLLIGGGMLAVAGFAAYVALSAREPALVAGGNRLRFVVGERITYDVDWSATTAVAVGPSSAESGQLDARSRIAGSVDVETVAADRDEATLAVSFTRIGTFELTMQGRDAIGSRDETRRAIEGKRAFVRISKLGEVRSITYDDDLPPSAKNALRGLVMQMQLTLGDGDRWKASEPVAVGRMSFDYASDGGAITRTPASLVTLDVVRGPLDGRQDVAGGAQFELVDGQLARITDHEAWVFTRAGSDQPAVSAKIDFSLHRTAVARFDVRTVGLPHLPAMALDEQPVDPDLERRLDIALARDLTPDEMLTGIEHFEVGQQPANDYVARVGAYLRLHPDAASYLAAHFVRPELTSRGRGLIMDVLANAGDASAQTVMRDLLSTDAAHARGSRFGLLAQRFTMVAVPTADSEAFLEELFLSNRDTNLGAAQGAAATLGAVAGRLAHDQPGLARRATELLGSQLAHTRNPDLQRALIAGLGNAGDPSTVSLLRSFATHHDPQIRAEVAGALGATQTDAAREQLVSLVADVDSTVASLAFASLQRHNLRSSDWDSLADLARDGKTPASADGSFVDLVRTHTGDAGTSGREILVALRGRNVGPDNDLSKVINDLLMTH